MVRNFGLGHGGGGHGGHGGHGGGGHHGGGGSVFVGGGYPYGYGYPYPYDYGYPYAYQANDSAAMSQIISAISNDPKLTKEEKIRILARIVNSTKTLPSF